MNISFADVATQMNISKSLALALPRFYARTQISTQLNFQFSIETNSLEFSLGFSPREPSEEEYKILFEEINDAEKILLDEYIVNNAKDYENLAQMVFKHKESIKQIVSKHRNDFA